jgi:hypothetical protein
MKRLVCIIYTGILLAVVLHGCGAGRGSVKSDYISLSHNGLVLDILYIDKYELNRTYGNRNNPFTGGITGPTLTFEIIVMSEVPARIDLSRVTLESDQGRQKPISKEWMLEYWQEALGYVRGVGDRESATYHNWSEKVTLERIETEMLPEVVELAPGEEESGLILFDPLRNFKPPATLHVPVYDRGDELLHSFTHEFTP